MGERQEPQVRRLTAGLLAGALVAFVPLAFGAPAHAAKCPPASVGGKTIGWIEFDDVKVPLKDTDYPPGGELDPPPSNKVAGVSEQHQGLLSTIGTTVVAWHVRYGKGCKGTLNPLLRKEAGDTFDIVTRSGERQTYELTEKTKVKRGRYSPDWFRLHGAPQVTLFTCSDLRKGKYRNTRVLVAVPAQSA